MADPHQNCGREQKRGLSCNRISVGNKNRTKSPENFVPYRKNDVKYQHMVIPCLKNDAESFTEYITTTVEINFNLI